MRAIGQYVPDAVEIVELIQRRIASIRRNTKAGAYMLVDSQSYVYLLRSDSCVAEEMVRRLPAMLVGLYLVATTEQIIEDIEAHISDLKIRVNGVNYAG
jgi:hypothetical protein